jgi:GT2 family glycosyltransferase
MSSEPSRHIKVTVVIPVHDAGTHLERCLASLAASVQPATAIVVVENGSTDDAAKRAQAAWPGIEFLMYARNLGFGGACNRGIQRALELGHDFVFLLNQDAMVEPDTLRRVLDLAMAHPRAAIVGSKTLSTTRGPDGAPFLLYNGAWRRCLPLWQRIPGVNRSSRDASNVPRQVDYVWGHGMLIRSEALRALGGFDPQYFMYYEDIDLCITMKRAGWEIWCDSRTFMWHDIADTIRAGDSEPRRWEWKVASSRYFHRKYFPPVVGYIVWCLSMLREAATLTALGHGRALFHLLTAWTGMKR